MILHQYNDQSIMALSDISFEQTNLPVCVYKNIFLWDFWYHVILSIVYIALVYSLQLTP